MGMDQHVEELFYLYVSRIMFEANLVNCLRYQISEETCSFIEEFKNIPFKIARVYWIYDVPGGEVRGGHAYRENEEFIVALSGSFDVVLDDGKKKKIFSLNRSYYGLYVPKGLWREMNNFSTNSLALVLASTTYNREDIFLIMIPLNVSAYEAKQCL